MFSMREVTSPKKALLSKHNNRTFFPVALRPNSSSWSPLTWLRHHTQGPPHSVGVAWMRDQPNAEIFTWQHTACWKTVDLLKFGNKHHPFRNKRTKQSESARIITLFTPNTTELCTSVCFLHEPARFVKTQWKFIFTQLEVQLLKSWKW